MGQTVIRQRALYLDTNDTVEEIGITRRQLKYWEDTGLLVPERGKGSGRYTEKDLEQLRLIKRLVVDEHFPVDFAKRLIQGDLLNDGDPDGEFVGDRGHEFLNRLLDLDSGELLTRQRAFAQLWNEFGATADEFEVDAHFYQLALLLFRLIQSESRNPAYYKMRLDEIMEELQALSIVARVSGEYDEEHSLMGTCLQPRLSGESCGGIDEGRARLAQVKRHYRKLEGFKEAYWRLVMQDREPVLNAKSKRFFDDDVIEAAELFT